MPLFALPQQMRRMRKKEREEKERREEREVAKGDEESRKKGKSKIGEEGGRK